MSGRAIVLGIDAGGTMTDTFIVDETGEFTVGKAATTPHDESVGFLESAADAASYWKTDHSSLYPELEVALYSGTTMLNTLLTRRGKKVGLVTTKGFEDDILMGRGMQSWTGYSYSDRIHAVTHVHPAPLMERRHVYGVTERVDMFGDPVIPLYEHEVKAAADALVADGVEAIVVHFLYSYLNPSHERRAEEIIQECLARSGRKIPVYLGSSLRPVIRENSRLNAALIEAFAVGPVREQLYKVEEAVRSRGYRYSLQTLLAYGGLCNIRYPRLHETLISGPVGGVMGAKYISALTGMENIIVTDLGGTSFDIGTITRGYVPVDAEPVLARFKLNLPTIAMESIGAGAGSYVTVDPVTKKVQIGPGSAGSTPGPVCFQKGGTVATITDCDLVLGYLNPDYFLGGKQKLDKQAALEALKEQVTGVIGIDVYAGAEAIVSMNEREARDAIRAVASARGLDTSQYYLFGYGGAGPLHLAGYSEGLDFRGVITFHFAAAFSAFGATTADYEHRYSRSVPLALPAGADRSAKLAVAKAINKTWEEMEKAAREEMTMELARGEKIKFTHLAMIRYGGQLSDLEVVSSLPRLRTDHDVDRLIAAWEDLYSKINSRVARYEQAGYQIFELGLLASVNKVKPRILRQPLGDPKPDKQAHKGTRNVYRKGRWTAASVWEMELLRPGNRVKGPAIIEHPATTLVVPEGKRIETDEFNFFWLK
ncbi:MAG TPA: hydantoinase/oxoprolinase family protein [Candidatus Binataceae bacterium]|nr:hydantoinase/oxoprolinase family protein [Candidatus Binataceae bacterium]